MGGGILPVTVRDDGKLCFLFGKENKYADTPGWSDFAGGNEKGETDYQTALREGAEELTGFLGHTDNDIERQLNRHGFVPVQVESYTTHVFPYPYNPFLTTYYNSNQAFLQQRLPAAWIRDSKVFEKAEIEWMTWEDMRRRRRQFRPFYRRVVDQLFAQRTGFESFVRRALSGRPTSGTRRQSHLKKQPRAFRSRLQASTRRIR
jgi:8-oxo-dGTP pyrophosphatase MutT (NUDIX family)